MGDRGVSSVARLTAYRAVDGRRSAAGERGPVGWSSQIETLAGIEHVDEILSVPRSGRGVIGPYDLSTVQRGGVPAMKSPSTFLQVLGRGPIPTSRP